MPRSNIVAAVVLATALVGHAVVTVLSASEHAPSEDEAPATRSAAEPPSAQEPSPRELAELAAHEAQRVLAFHTRRHGQEPRDAAWSRKHEQEIGDFLATDAFAGSTVESVDCRTSQCRVVVAHHDDEAARRLREAWGRGPFRYGGSSHFDARTQSTTLFLGREGYAFQHPTLGPPPDDEG